MKILSKKFLHPRFWPNWLGLVLMRISIYLPKSWQLFAGHSLGRLMRLFMKDRERVARRNLELCFPEMSQQERKELLSENMLTMGMMPGTTGMVTPIFSSRSMK